MRAATAVCPARFPRQAGIYLRGPRADAARHSVDIGSDFREVAGALFAPVFCAELGAEPNMFVIERPAGRPWRIWRVVNMVQTPDNPKKPARHAQGAEQTFRQDWNIVSGKTRRDVT
jgi:hypothetical protein